MNLNSLFVVTPLTDFITGKIIESGTSQVPAKMVARAQELIAINTAMGKVIAGDADGLTALSAALTTTALSVGESLALQSLFASLSTRLALLTSIEGSTIAGQAAADILTSILTAGSAVAQGYVTKYAAPAA